MGISFFSSGWLGNSLPILTDDPINSLMQVTPQKAGPVSYFLDKIQFSESGKLSMGKRWRAVKDGIDVNSVAGRRT